MPKIRPDAPNGGYPERQKPVTSQGELAPTELATFSWEEVCKHTSLESLWVVIDGFVYDVTSWAAQHPGGQQILLSLAGKDASSAFRKAKHSEATQVFKLNYRIGQVRLVSSNQTSSDARGSEA